MFNEEQLAHEIVNKWDDYLKSIDVYHEQCKEAGLSLDQITLCCMSCGKTSHERGMRNFLYFGRIASFHLLEKGFYHDRCFWAKVTEMEEAR